MRNGTAHYRGVSKCRLRVFYVILKTDRVLTFVQGFVVLTANVLFYDFCLCFLLNQSSEATEKANLLVDSEANPEYLNYRSQATLSPTHSMFLHVLKQNGPTVIKYSVHYWPTDSILYLICQHGALETSGD